jgi:hypothetical protein
MCNCSWLCYRNTLQIYKIFFNSTTNKRKNYNNIWTFQIIRPEGQVFRLKCAKFAHKRESKRLPRGKINHFQCPKFLKECLICVFEDIQKAIEHFWGNFEQRKSKINGEFCTLKK